MASRPSIGPIPPPEVYICWAQRSLLRQGYLPGLEVDGADSALYRDAIAAFQTDNGLPRHRKMDEATQDRLIELNHVDSAYTAWVQRALVSAGLLKPSVGRTEPIMERAGSLTRQAIRRLQQQRFDKGGGLKPDGWVGAKTERVLRTFIAAAPPDGTGAPAPCKAPTTRPSAPTRPAVMTDEQLRGKLRQAIDWMNECGSSAFYAHELCVARKLMTSGVDDGFIDAQRMQRFFNDKPSDLSHYFSSARRVLEVKLRSLRETGRTVAAKDIVESLQNIQQDMVEGMNRAYYKLTGQEIYDAWRKSQLERGLGSRVSRSTSLYSCAFAKDHYAASIATLS